MRLAGYAFGAVRYVDDLGLGLERRSFDAPPNANDPADVPPATVGPPEAVPGDPNGVEIVGERRPSLGLHAPRPMAWSGWPAEWQTPAWAGSKVQLLTDTAWTCLDSNASILSTMPPYLVGAAPTLGADWLVNPDPDLYTCWEEFAKALFWDYQALGEVYVLTTARYATGWPARFHVVPPWMVDAEVGPGGRKRFAIGGVDVTADMLQVTYTSRIGDAHGRGPLEVGAPRLVAAAALARYAQAIASSGGVPTSVLVHPSRLTREQAEELQAQWVDARASSIGLPAVLSGGIDFKPLQLDPERMALVDLAQWNEARIAVLLRVPPVCVALPSGGDPMTYTNTSALFDYRWRDGLRPIAQRVMSALSYWALPRGTVVELNRDDYVRPTPLEVAQVHQIYAGLGVLTAEQIAEAQRFNVAAPTETLTSGMLA